MITYLELRIIYFSLKTISLISPGNEFEHEDIQAGAGKDNLYGDNGS